MGSQLRETGEGGSFEGTSGGGVPLLLPPRLTTGTVWDRDGSVEIVEGTLDKVQESGSNSDWLPTTHCWRGHLAQERFPAVGEVFYIRPEAGEMLEMLQELPTNQIPHIENQIPSCIFLY